MVLEVKWSPEAAEDLQSIAEYIERDSPYYASAVVTEMLAVSRSIADFPRIGRIVPEISDETIRERFVYSYRLIYQIQASQILILAVIHGKRLLEPVLDRLGDNKEM